MKTKCLYLLVPGVLTNKRMMNNFLCEFNELNFSIDNNCFDDIMNRKSTFTKDISAEQNPVIVPHISLHDISPVKTRAKKIVPIIYHHQIKIHQLFRLPKYIWII